MRCQVHGSKRLSREIHPRGTQDQLAVWPSDVLTMLDVLRHRLDLRVRWQTLSSSRRGQQEPRRSQHFCRYSHWRSFRRTFCHSRRIDAGCQQGQRQYYHRDRDCFRVCTCSQRWKQWSRKDWVERRFGSCGARFDDGSDDGSVVLDITLCSAMSGLLPAVFCLQAVRSILSGRCSMIQLDDQWLAPGSLCSDVHKRTSPS
jgi:hypothetical protein